MNVFGLLDQQLPDELRAIAKDMRECFLKIIEGIWEDVLPVAYEEGVQPTCPGESSPVLQDIADHAVGLNLRPRSCLPCSANASPPHCLKKNAVLALRHAASISATHCSAIGRERGPLLAADDCPMDAAQIGRSHRTARTKQTERQH